MARGFNNRNEAEQRAVTLAIMGSKDYVVFIDTHIWPNSWNIAPKAGFKGKVMSLVYKSGTVSRSNDPVTVKDLVSGKTPTKEGNQGKRGIDMALPERDYDTMSEAIALGSPSGRMSKRAKEAAQKRLSESLFGKGGLQAPQGPKQPSEKETLLRRAKELRDLASRGMKPRAFVKEAEKLEAQAMKLGNQGKRGNPDSTPNDPREIAADLRILKAKQKLVRLEGKQGNPDLSGTPKGYNWELVFVEWPTNTQRVERAHNFEVDSYEGAVKKAKWLAGASQDYSHIGNREFEFDIYNKGKLKGYCNWNLRGNSANIRFTRHKASKFENPSTLSSSQSLVESFHGRSHNSVDDIITFDSFPDSLAELGELRELVIVSPRFKGKLPIGFDENGNGVVKLASAPGGTQYVLVGGDQGIDPDSLVEDFGISTDEIGDEWQRKVVLGEIVSLTYYTDKHHLSGPKYQKDGCLYEHQLGEEGGELPTLVYDPNNESLEIVGGSYVTKEEGIRN